MGLVRRGWLIAKRRWWLFLLPIVIAFGGVYAYDFFWPKDYTTQTTLFLRSPDVKTSASAYQGNLFTMQRVNTYVKMVQSDELAQLVIDKLGLDTSAHDLASRVEAKAQKDTVLLTVSVSDPNPDESANIANTYGTEFATYVAKVEAVSPTADLPPLVTVIKPAFASDAKTGMFPMKYLLIGAGVIGLSIAALLVWLAERYDTKLRSRRQIEELTDTTVLGSLPPETEIQNADAVEALFSSSDEFADAARALSINVEHALREVSKVNGAAVLAMASADRGDGKSVIASALATAWKERGHRVGLVRVGSGGGRESQVADAPTQAIATGVRERAVRTQGVPTEHDISVVIEELSQGSDFIIVDPPGPGASAETQLAGSLSDAALVVARPGQTDESALVDAVNAMNMLNTPVIGIVANQAREVYTEDRLYA
jgi:capsular polysaccharide biosynthesis protein